jgi:hypothetical protein
VELLAGFANVGGVAIEREPEVFDEVIAKGFENAAVEFHAGGI